MSDKTVLESDNRKLEVENRYLEGKHERFKLSVLKRGPSLGR